MDSDVDTSLQNSRYFQPNPTPPASIDPDEISSSKPRYPVPDPEPIPTPTPPPHPPDPTTQPASEYDIVSQSQPAHVIDSEQTPEPVQQDPSADSALDPTPTKEDPLRPHTGRYQPSHPAYRLSQFQLRKVAASTLRRLELGYYILPSTRTTRTVQSSENLTSQELNGEVVGGGSDTSVNGNGQSVEDIKEVENSEPETVRQRYDLASKIEWTNAHTEYWSPDAPELSGSWDVEDWSGADLDPDAEMDALLEAQSLSGSDSQPQSQSRSLSEDGDDQTQMDTEAALIPNAKPKTRILIKEYSTLVGARKLHAYLRENPPASGNTTIGVLNFASAKKPGGGFIKGAQAQEESIARTSTLYPSLISDTAAPFYLHHVENPNDAIYTHAMVYSPRVVLFRNDKGLYMRPIEVDVLTCAAVNAGEVRRQEERERKEREREQARMEWKEQMSKLRERVRKAEAAREKRREEEERKREELQSAGAGDNDTELREESVQDEMKAGVMTNQSEHVEADRSDDGPPPDSEVETDATPQPVHAVSSLPSSTAATAASTPHTKHLDLEPESTTPIAQSSPTPASPTLPPLRTPSETEHLIACTMYTRIARILALFRHSKAPHLILGSFGTGVFQNHIPLVAHIFWDLLVKEGAPFEGVFENVVFAILGSGTVRVFREVFGVVDRDADDDKEDEVQEEEVGDLVNLPLNEDDVAGGGDIQDGANPAASVPVLESRPGVGDESSLQMDELGYVETNTR